MNITLWRPVPRRVFHRLGLSPARAERARVQSLLYADLTHLAAGFQPDPVWLAEWAGILARRVRAMREG